MALKFEHWNHPHSDHSNAIQSTVAAPIQRNANMNAIKTSSSSKPTGSIWATMATQRKQQKIEKIQQRWPVKTAEIVPEPIQSEEIVSAETLTNEESNILQPIKPPKKMVSEAVQDSLTPHLSETSSIVSTDNQTLDNDESKPRVPPLTNRYHARTSHNIDVSTQTAPDPIAAETV